jgi:hypothetical protein
MKTLANTSGIPALGIAMACLLVACGGESLIGKVQSTASNAFLILAKVQAEKMLVEPEKKQSFRVLTDFMVDPMTYGWQNGGEQATSIQNHEDLERFNAMVQKTPSLTNPSFWKGDTPDKKLGRALKKHEIDLTKEVLVVLRYSTGPKDKIAANSELKDGVLTVQVSAVHVGNGGPQPLTAAMKPIAVVVDRSKVDKVVFEYWGKKSETEIRKDAGKVAPMVIPENSSMPKELSDTGHF